MRSAVVGAFLLLACASAGDSSGSSLRYPVIAAAGDIACDPVDVSYNGGRGTSSACQELATSNLLLQGRYAAVLALGDEQYENGALAKYEVSYAMSWGRVLRITRPAPGNHEYETSGAPGYFAYFGRAAGPSGRGYYSFNLGGWHIVSLNSNCSAIGGCQAGSPEEQWLRSDLARHRTRCTLAYWHHPRFSSGPDGNQTQVAGLWSALYAAGADVVLSGHDHDYERFAPLNAGGALDRAHGIREFVVGTGGRSHDPIASPERESRVHDSSSFGILKLTLRSTGYDWRFIPAVGSFTDHGSGRCH